MTTPQAHDAAKPLSPALDKTFKIGLVLKGLDGILEVAGGILLLFLAPHAIQHLVRVLTAHELSEDPHDLIAHYLLHTTAHLGKGTTIFGAVYLLSHGIAKIVLVALVLKDKLWAYPWLIVLLLAFIAYQLYRITAVHFSIGLTLLTVFDAFLVWLTWREYRAKRARQHHVKAPAAAQLSQDKPVQLDDSGKGGVAGEGAGPLTRQRGDAGVDEAGLATPPEHGEDNRGAVGPGGQPGQQDGAGKGACGDGGDLPVSAAGGMQPAGQDNQQGAPRTGDDHPGPGLDPPRRPAR
jgi:uncharacterized membrane protein